MPGAFYFCPVSQGEITANTRKYACGVIAMTNMMSYLQSDEYPNALKNYSLYDTFNNLWSLSNVIISKTEGGVTYGGNYNSDLGPAIIAHLKPQGYTATTNGYAFVSYSDFKRDIKANKSCIFGYEANDNDGVRSGHFVFVFGFVETKGDDWLRVADGWGSYFMYLNFSSQFYKTTGFSVTVKPTNP